MQLLASEGTWSQVKVIGIVIVKQSSIRPDAKGHENTVKPFCMMVPVQFTVAMYYILADHPKSWCQGAPKVSNNLSEGQT